MDIVKRKTIAEIVLTCVIIVLVAFILPKNSESGKSEPDKPSVTVKDTTFTRYPARVITDGTQIARDKYGLPSPIGNAAEQVSQNAVRQSARADDSFFDNAVFIGDSVTECLYKTVLRQRVKQTYLGQAQFFISPDYGLYEATRSSTSDRAIHPYYNNKQMTPGEIVQVTGADKVYLCLGLNDLALYTTENCLKYYQTLLDAIREKNPDVRVYVQSVTPVTLYGESRLLYNAKIDAFNVALSEFARQNGCCFLYIADVLKDTEGYLAYPLSSDDNRLLEREACALWADYLYTHTGESE